MLHSQTHPLADKPSWTNLEANHFSKLGPLLTASNLDMSSESLPRKLSRRRRHYRNHNESDTPEVEVCETADTSDVSPTFSRTSAQGSMDLRSVNGAEDLSLEADLDDGVRDLDDPLGEEISEYENNEDAAEYDSDVGAGYLDELTRLSKFGSTLAGNNDGPSETSGLPQPRQGSIYLTPTEEGMLELVRLIDSSGAPRGLYDEIVSLIKRRGKNGFDPTKAYSRERFVTKLRREVNVPIPVQSTVHGHTVFRFPFLEMLQDLFDSPVWDSVDNLCVNRDEAKRFSKYIPPDDCLDDLEIMCRRWASDTYDGLKDFVEGEHLFLPLILYADKTGTDKMQRYPLEPWMFTTPLLRRHARESAGNWRHLGFVPSVQEFVTERSVGSDHREDDDETDDHCGSVSQRNLQMYHDFLYCILTELRGCCESKPLARVNLGGQEKTVRLHTHISLILGDQLSQDVVCGRVSNNTTSSGRVHRACMRSSACSSDARDGSCRELIDPSLVEELNFIAMQSKRRAMKKVNDLIAASVHHLTSLERKAIDDCLKVKINLARSIIAKPFSLHPLRNGFRGVSFGCNKHGVYVATADDHLHSMEAGLVMYVNAAVHDGFTKSEGKKFDDFLRVIQAGSRSSVSSRYPNVKIKKNFNSQSLMTHTEKVGSLFNTLLALHFPTGRGIFNAARVRQVDKYNAFEDDSTKGKSVGGDVDSGSDSSADSGSNEESSSSSTSDEENESGSNGDLAEDDSTLSDDEGEGLCCEKRSEKCCRYPHRTDYLFGADCNDKNPFDRTDDTIRFLVDELRRHGFNKLTEAHNLDEVQVEQLLVSANKALKGSRCKGDDRRYPSKSTVGFLSQRDPLLARLLGASHEQRPSVPCPLESACVSKVKREIKRKASSDGEGPGKYHFSFSVDGCTEKHRRKRPKVKGSGATCAILCPPGDFVYFIEYVLCYHAWCHYGHLLPKEYRENVDLIEYGSRLVVRYFDTFVYRGDDTNDSDTGKLHSQLHTARVYEWFGDWMQCNSAIGERGLKTWAKFYSQTARKRGLKIFHQDTSSRIWEQMLYRKVWDSLERSVRQEPDSEEGTKPRTILAQDEEIKSIRRHCHFVYRASDPRRREWMIYRVDRKGEEEKNSHPDSSMVHGRVLDHLRTIEEQQSSFCIWCEAQIKNGDWIRCWPQYRQTEGPYFDWVYARFALDDGTDGGCFPAKLLCLYKDEKNRMKALVHSVEDKMKSRREGRYGDSLLVRHYRRQFLKKGRRCNFVASPEVYSIYVSDIVCTLLAYEAKPSSDCPLPPQMPYDERLKHTVAVIRPRQEWAELFLDWTQELRERQADNGKKDRYKLAP